MIIEFRASKSFYWKQSKWDQQKFILILLLRLYLLFCFKVTVSKETVGFVVRNSDDFELYQTVFRNKNYHNRLFNSTVLFVVCKWPWRIETVVIKLNEMKLKCLKFLFSKFCRLLREDTNKSRLAVKKFFLEHIRTSFSSLRAPQYTKWWY